MAERRDVCTVTSSWTTEDGRRPADVVLYRHEPECAQSEEKVPTPGGIFPTPKDDDPASSCDINITISESNTAVPVTTSSITAVDLVCDGRRIEVFSDKAGYLASAEGVRVDEELALDQKLFMLQYSFDDPVSSCCLKVLQHTNTNRLWLYSLYITIEQTRSGFPSMGIPASLGMPSGAIDLDKVKTMLTDMGGNISEKGQGLLSTMEVFKKNQACGPPAAGGFGQMAAMMSMFAGMRASPSQQAPPSMPTAASVSDTTQTVNTSDTTQAQLQSATPPKENMSPKNTTVGLTSNLASGLPSLSVITSQLERTIQKCVEDAEKRISAEMTAKVEASESRIQEKLDRILDLLQPDEPTEARTLNDKNNWL